MSYYKDVAMTELPSTHFWVCNFL